MMLNIIVSTTILSLSSIKDTDGTGFIFDGFFTMAFWTNVYQNLSISRIVELLDQLWIVILSTSTSTFVFAIMKLMNFGTMVLAEHFYYNRAPP
ncbi:hypothetical protein GCK72_016109 [Caenorhabditis remanei]|uniref:Uncharacterized protein n=1 Tax=Caenorhabditis remanei TaxID=31234 RepID=A0A6A5GZB5_CAERE|nr:hypothetical protein GCK72_016109 [Caenorhabditis remanei]KAF1759642.1 hypothetical protein GCK72_016109 [Caenorhabditis remanei]